MGDSGELSPSVHSRALETLRSTELDVLVIGGGVVGAGAALDAATRGLTVGIVEARDWAAGTSSRSSKLIHGGLRYLEMLDFGLVREALQERGLLMERLAPHLVRPVPFLYPLTTKYFERPYVGAGIGLYDALSFVGSRNVGLPVHKHLSRRAMLRGAPSLKPDAFVGAIRYYDAQVDDARFVMSLVRTAVKFGATAVNRTSVTELVRENGRVVGARVRVEETGEEFVIRAKTVLSAAGVWTHDVQADASGKIPDGVPELKVRASKGVHLVVPRDRFHATTGLILKTAISVLFVIPWGRHWIIGTTDTPWSLDKAHPAATSRDIDYLLNEINKVLITPLTRDDVEGVYAGLRPLVEGNQESTAKLSREHVVTHPEPGLAVIAGGKYTTYRVMAKDAIDAVANMLPFTVPDSVTNDISLVGAEGHQALWNQRERLADRSGISDTKIEHLLHRYGSMIHGLLDLIAQDPALAEDLDGSEDYLAAEAVYAVTHEGARHLTDVLTRRTRISIESWDRGLGAAPQVARLMQPLLGWSDEFTQQEIDSYTARVEAERESQEQLTDEGADAVRLSKHERDWSSTPRFATSHASK
ncbi:glycerol-3-phosphate dehydrogenase [Neomicrococcus aestuarii]|uniref:Glycerol-3-phosphate dehydrogenase n=1 Tax=Neomicrococcus aestuarii TaxID=556325 RepID=A0A7W8WZP3_9MICC|nr:glycerol-3-phosphate dehydrogenase/oxidase [Neomicrococcus aestuarii]MBB5513606.1 glycerol-3-phosphate dehydrogenase [Neomicrococcus aestuarii]